MFFFFNKHYSRSKNKATPVGIHWGEKCHSNKVLCT